MLIRPVIALVALVLGVAACTQTPRERFDRLVVCFQDEAALLEATQRNPSPVFDACSATIEWRSRIAPELIILRVPRGQLDMAETLCRTDSRVNFVAPDVATYHQAIVPSDPEWKPNQFADYPAFKSCLEALWNSRKSSDTIVAVLDCGVAFDTVEFAANMWTNPNEVDNGVDDDKNGIIDDLHGCEFVDPKFALSPPSEPHSVPGDRLSHGTEVACMLGAVGDNAFGIAGTLWSARIMACRHQAEITSVTQMSDTIKAIDYAASEGARIVNCSWYYLGTPASVAPLRHIMLKSRRTLFVIAAGNEGLDLDSTSGVGVDYWPAEFDITNSIVVGNSDGKDARTISSNFGPSSVDIFAPGNNHRVFGVDGKGNLFIGNDTGTSLAAPIVAAVAAMVWDDHPTFTPKDIKDHLIATADPIPALNGLCGGPSGCRRLNPMRAVTGQACPITP